MLQSCQKFSNFLFWVKYDGFYFGEMAKGNTRRSIVDWLELSISHCTGCDLADMRLFPTSRTDKFVHAVRSPFLLQLPSKYESIEKMDNKIELLSNLNTLSHNVTNSALSFLDFNSVSPGFHPRFHVTYRKYVYRIYLPKSYSIYSCFVKNPTLVSFSETNYAWLVYPWFDINKAQKVCSIFQSQLWNFASFYKHSDSHRIRNLEYRNTYKLIELMKIELGEPYSIPNDEYIYYNITIVSKSFLREQIRRMMAVLVSIASGIKSIDFLYFMLKNPDPRHFFVEKPHLISAPPSGLFLADVVYDPNMFKNPSPFYFKKNIIEDNLSI